MPRDIARVRFRALGSATQNFVFAADLALLVQQLLRLAPVPHLAQPQDGRLLPRGGGLVGELTRSNPVLWGSNLLKWG